MNHKNGKFSKLLLVTILILALTSWMVGIQTAPAQASHDLCHWCDATICPGSCPFTIPPETDRHISSFRAAQVGLNGLTVTIKVEIYLSGLPGTGTVYFSTGDGNDGRFPDGIAEGEYQGDANGTISFNDGRTLTWKRTKPGPVVIEVGYPYLSKSSFGTVWSDCCDVLLGERVAARAQVSTAITTPSQPQNVTASTGAEGGQILLDWDAPSSGGGTSITGYRIRRSASPGGPADIVDVPAAATAYTDDRLPNDTTFYYRISAFNRAGEGPAAPEVSAATLPVYSDDCAEGTTLVSGSAGGVQVNIATKAQDPRTTWLCLSAVSGSFGRGGKLELTTADPADPPQPRVDDQSMKCESEPANLYTSAPLTAEAGDPSDPAYLRYYLHFYASLGEVWACLEVENGGETSAHRVVLPLAGKIVFSPDPINSGPLSSPVNTGAESSKCEANGGQSILEGTVEGTSLWLTLWQPSSSVAHICVRAQGGASYGGRLEIDAAQTPGLEVVTEVGNDDSLCTKNLVTIGSVSIKRGSDANTSTICVFDGAKWSSVTAGTQGTLSVPAVAWWQD